MIYLRSLLFNILFLGGSLFWSIALLWVMFLPRRKANRMVSIFYGGYIALIERYVLGLKLEIRGLEHLPQTGSYILAAKHQSAYETLKLPFMKEARDPAIVLKISLARIPLWGLYPRKMGFICIDRGSAMQSLNSIVKGALRVKAEERPMIIFPEGTRRPVDAAPDYKFGIAKVYKETKLPIVPMALNSGLYWGRNSFWKKSGTVIFEFLPMIEAELPHQEMLKRLESAIEPATEKLLHEGKRALGQ
jgi:1-acyl-sn-glycerol-3-phosphate acyltransferase